jgi:hypothetical protein
MHALVGEAMKKAAIIWVAPGADQPPYPLWCLPIDGALYVVTDGDEQPAPGLGGATTATVAARGDHGGLIATWTAQVQRVRPGGADWDAVAPLLAAKRLNTPGSAAALVDVWTATSTITRLTPIDDEPRPAR